MGTDRNSMWNLFDKIKLLDADLIDFVEDVDGWDVDSVSFNTVDQLIGCRVFIQCHVRVVDFVFFQNRLKQLSNTRGLVYCNCAVNLPAPIPCPIPTARLLDCSSILLFPSRGK